MHVRYSECPHFLTADDPVACSICDTTPHNECIESGKGNKCGKLVLPYHDVMCLFTVYIRTAGESSLSDEHHEWVTSKPRFSFPFLNLKNMSDEEKEMLHQKLYAESEDMTYKFQKLFKATRRSLLAQKVSVGELLKHFDCLGSVEPTFRGSTLPVLGCQLPDLRKTGNIDDVMAVISSYCSFFNYRIVEEIIDNLGTKEDKMNLVKYKEEFSKYAQRHVFECPSKLGEMREIDHANMFVTLDAIYDNYTVSHLYAFVGNLQKVLNVPALSLRLCRVAPGSVKLIFQLPHIVHKAIFPLTSQQETDLAALGIIQLSCGDYLFAGFTNKVCIYYNQMHGHRLNCLLYEGNFGCLDVGGHSCSHY